MPPLDVPKNIRLGQRMEYFMEAAIMASQRYELIAKNLQIIHNKKTLGEIDFLIRDLNENKGIHLELVYKFYLFDPLYSANKYACWIGPNRKDSLPLKLNKLKPQQLPLLFKPETLPYLSKIGLKPGEIEQKICFKAQLFTDFHTKITDISGLNPDSEIGFWMNLQDFKAFAKAETKFYFPVKIKWVILPASTDPIHWIDRTEAFKQIENSLNQLRSVYCWTKTPNDSISRCFVVWW
ncbi:DUF1853 family protein [Leeuwenhoekiella sp. A16]|uniref:DUF1853 family protein n=1 Tax=unclassified Leeuwenhoekiella TaxID=2615029 RepID=UPI003A7FBD40